MRGTASKTLCEPCRTLYAANRLKSTNLTFMRNTAIGVSSVFLMRSAARCEIPMTIAAIFKQRRQIRPHLRTMQPALRAQMLAKLHVCRSFATRHCAVKSHGAAPRPQRQHTSLHLQKHKPRVSLRHRYRRQRRLLRPQGRTCSFCQRKGCDRNRVMCPYAR